MPDNGLQRAHVRLLALAAVVLALLWTWALWPSRHSLIVTFIDVGEGDSILIQTPRGHAVLVDAGPPGSEEGSDAGFRAVAPLLRARGVTNIDLLVVTHPHSDHFGGVPSILAQFRVKRFAVPPLPPTVRPDPGYEQMLADVSKRRIPIMEARKGVAVRFPDGPTLRFLHPSASDISAPITDPNSVSAVSALQHGRRRILLCADADFETELKMACRELDLRADVLKVAHHGSAQGTSAAFLKAVRPRIAVVSSGRWGRLRHPSGATLGRLRAAGARVYQTRWDGNVTAETDGEKVFVRRSRNPLREQ